MTLFFDRNRMNPFSNITGILFMILLMVGLFYLAKGVFWVLAKMAIVFLAGAIIIHYPTVIDFGKWLWNTWKKNFLQGLVITTLSVLLYPILCAYLFFRSLLNRKVSQIESTIRKEREGEFVDFEELESTLNQRKDRLNNPKTKTEDRYQDLFE